MSPTIVVGTVTARLTSVVVPLLTGQFAELIVQVGPADASLQIEVPPTVAAPLNSRPVNSWSPDGSVDSRIRTESNALRAALAAFGT